MNRYLLSTTDKGFTFVWGNGGERPGAEVFHYDIGKQSTSSRGFQTLDKFPTEVIRRMMRGGDVEALPGGRYVLTVSEENSADRAGSEIWTVDGTCMGYYPYDTSKFPILY